MTAAVLFARDPGAANHVIAVADIMANRMEHEAVRDLIAALAGAPETVIAWGYGPALSVFEAAGLDVAPHEVLSVGSAASRLCETGARLLVTGAGDVDDVGTRRLWAAARRLGIPILTALDSPDNVEFRFDMASCVRPDRVIAPGVEALEALLRVGFSASDILVTENLHLLRLAALPPPDRGAVRRTWGVEEDACVVLFISENAAEARAMGRPVDFDEFALLDGVLRQAAAGLPIGPVRRDPGEIIVVIRPHPRDRAGKYDDFARRGSPRVIVSNCGTPAEAAVGADLVVGMRSAFLEEARILRRPVHRLL